MDLSQRIGELSSEHRERVTPESLAAFRSAILAPPGRTAPPTYMTRFRLGEFELIQSLGIQLSQLVHGEQEYEYGEAEIAPGMEITYRTKLIRAVEKKGSSGKMTILLLETEVRAAGIADRLGFARSTIIAREAGGASVA